VLALTCEANLLSPYCVLQKPPREYKGSIVTGKPNEMWGSGEACVFTTEEGWGWIFAAVEHWSAECMGYHLTKRGDRFAALEPLPQGFLSQFGSP
jgi:hypothetical protein